MDAYSGNNQISLGDRTIYHNDAERLLGPKTLRPAILETHAGLREISNFVVTGGSLEFVQCDCSNGPKGDELKAILEKIIKPGVDPIIHEGKWGWVVGGLVQPGGLIRPYPGPSTIKPSDIHHNTGPRPRPFKPMPGPFIPPSGGHIY